MTDFQEKARSHAIKESKPETRPVKDDASNEQTVVFDATTTESLLQLRMTVGRADDPAEVEAERLADAFLSSWKPDEVRTESTGALRSPDDGSEQGLLRTGGFTAGAQFEAALSAGSSGTPLPPKLQSEMGAFLGADISQVRVHADADAAELSRSIGAEAFTTGKDIYFGAGTYDPSSKKGQHLIAHEVVHTVQQGAVRRQGISRRIPNLPLQRLGTSTNEPTKQELQLDVEQKRTAKENAATNKVSAERDVDTATEKKVTEANKLQALTELQKAYNDLEEAEATLQQSVNALTALEAQVSSLTGELNGLHEESDSLSRKIEEQKKSNQKAEIAVKISDAKQQADEKLENLRTGFFNRVRTLAGFTTKLEAQKVAIQAELEDQLRIPESLLRNVEELTAKLSDKNQLIDETGGRLVDTEQQKGQAEAAKNTNQNLRDERSRVLTAAQGSAPNVTKDQLGAEITQTMDHIGVLARSVEALTLISEQKATLLESAEQELRNSEDRLTRKLIQELQYNAKKEREIQDLKSSKEVTETFAEGVNAGTGNADELSKAKWAPISEDAGKGVASAELVGKSVLVFTQAGDAISSLANWEATGGRDAAQKSTKAILTTWDLVAKSVYAGKELAENLGNVPGLEMVPVAAAVGAIFSIFEEWTQTTMPLWRTWGELNDNIKTKKSALQSAKSAALLDPSDEKKSKALQCETDLEAIKTVRSQVATNYGLSFGKVASDLAVAVGSFMTLGGAFIPGAATAAIGGLAKVTIGLGSFVAGWVRTAHHSNEVGNFEDATRQASLPDATVNDKDRYDDLYRKVTKYHTETAFKHVVVKALMDDTSQSNNLLHSLGLGEQWVMRQRDKLEQVNVKTFPSGVVVPQLLNDLEWDEARDNAVKFIEGGDVLTASERLWGYWETVKKAGKGIYAGLRGAGNWIASFFNRGLTGIAPNQAVATESLQLSLDALKSQALKPYVERKEVSPWRFGGVLLAGASHGVKDEKVLKFAQKYLAKWFAATQLLAFDRERLAAANDIWMQQIQSNLLDALRHGPLFDKGANSKIEAVNVDFEVTSDGRLTGIKKIVTSGTAGDPAVKSSSAQVSKRAVSRSPSARAESDDAQDAGTPTMKGAKPRTKTGTTSR
jgi:hypothetical protein